MKNKTDKDPIEDFFEKRLENFDISYMASDWEKLEAKLDVVSTQHVMRRRIAWLVAASVILFSSLGYFSYQNYISINDLKQEMMADNEQAEDPAIGQEEAQVPAIRDENENDSLAQAQDDVNDKPVTNNTTVQENVVPVPINDAIASVDQGRKRSKASVARKSAAPLSIQGKNCKDCGSDTRLMKSVESTVAGLNIIDDEGSALESVFAANQIVTFDVDQNTQPRAFSRFAVGVSFGSDVNAVNGFSNFSNPGYNIGVKAEYNFTSRFSAIAGVQRIQMQYSAQAGQYTVPMGFWTNGIAANGTNAECRMFDVSLTLKYSFVELSRSRFFATGGVSNMIMVDEQYNFMYSNQNPNLVQQFNGSTGTNDFINSASFSIGYEYDFDSRIGIRFEPFFRVPVNRVGFGNVDLYSMGSSVSFRYNIGR